MDPEALARRLLEAADQARYRHPQRALQRAVSARDFAASLELGELGEDGEAVEGEDVREAETSGAHARWLALQSDAWAVLGSAHRTAGDVRRAEGALLVALAFLDARPVGESRRRARLAQRAAYVRCDQGRHEEALDLLEESRRIYGQLGETQREAATRVDTALVLRRQGHPEPAVAELAAALDVLDRGAEPRSYLAAVHNMAHLLLESARDEAEEAEALRWLDLACHEHGQHPEALNILRLRAVAALTASRLGRTSAARHELGNLAGDFAELGAHVDEALALLHLAELLLAAPDLETEARVDEVLKLSGRLFPLLGRLPLDPDAHEALLGLLAGARRRDLTVEAVRRTAEHVERSLAAS